MGSTMNSLHQPSQATAHASPLRNLGLAATLGLAVLLLFPALASAAPAARPQLSGDTLSAHVIGGARVGVWRIRIVAPDGREQIDFVLRSGNINWSAVARTSRRTDSGWSPVSRQRISGTPSGLANAGGNGAGVTWSSADFRLPRNGDGRFTIDVTLERDGSYRVAGAVRSASEAFSYGPWQPAGSGQVNH